MDRRHRLFVLPALAWAILASAPVAAQEPVASPGTGAADSTGALGTEAWLTPPPEIMATVLAAGRRPIVELEDPDPGRRFFLHPVEDGLPPMARFARPYHDLGQLQIDPAAGRARSLTTRSHAGYELIPADGGEPVRVQVPEGARVSGAVWSPDGTRLAFLAHFDAETHAYVADAADGRSRRVTRTPVLATLVTDLRWTGDGEHLVTVLVPEGRGPEPVRSAVPGSPMVRLTTEGENRLRTYFDLLESPFERSLVEYWTTGQLAVLDAQSRDVHRVGAPAMIEDVDPSPDGRYFRVTTLRPPFSYIVPVSQSATAEELWDRDGRVVATLVERPLQDGRERDDDDTGGDDRRGLTWRVDGPGLVYVQMEPRPDSAESAGADVDTGGDADAAVGAAGGGQEGSREGDRPRRQDRVVAWSPPFDSASVEILYATPERIRDFAFDATGRTLFLTRRSGARDDATETLNVVFLDDPGEEHRVYRHRTGELRGDPGTLLTRPDPSGRTVVRTSPDGGAAFLRGTEYFEDPLTQAPRPFLDRVDLRSGARERVFRSAPDAFEQVTAVLDDAATRLVVMREGPATVPDAWIVDLGTGERTRLTTNVDPTPRITAARRESVMIARPDGFRSRVQVTLPAGWRPGTPLPAMFWFYPREYTDQDNYDERGMGRFNRNAYPAVAPRSMDILTLDGYAVVEPDLPVVGDAGQMNDNYVQDLRNTLSAVIDTLAARGWIDRDRLAIGGHSYGAFGTVNAMVNTPFFKAGIAGDGNYNRSLTPAGFQTERRMLWEAEQIYIEMSPFFFADRLTGALLMYHGMDDHNVGTHPTHSKRLFHALNVLGKTAALYMYPYEDHGPATRETTLDLWARWTAWLDRYVKRAGAGSTPAVTTETGTER